MLQYLQRPSETTTRLMKNLLVFVLLNLACWIPIEILLTLSMSGVHIDAHLISWFSILVVPHNSLPNPFTYTIGGIIIKKHNVK